MRRAIQRHWVNQRAAAAFDPEFVEIAQHQTPRPELRSHPYRPEGFLILSQMALLLRRLDQSQLFDTFQWPRTH
jgi:hypothetical protein